MPIEPHFLEIYAAHYTHTNLLLETLNDMPKGTALTSSQIVSDAKLHQSEFYGGGEHTAVLASWTCCLPPSGCPLVAESGWPVMAW
jgi:hypothetical protein